MEKRIEKLEQDLALLLREKELNDKKMDILISHIEHMENKNKGFFSFFKSKLKTELEALNLEKRPKIKAQFKFNDD